MRRVIGIGETVLDILFKNDQPQKSVPGGSTFNSIVSLGRAGVPCVMVTEVGGDHIGDIICNYLSTNGVSPEYVCRHEHIKSHISLAFLDEHNDAQYVFYKDHASVSLDGVMPDICKDDVVLFGSFFAINPVIRPVVGGLLHAARKAGAWLYYDVNFRKPHIADLPDVMPNIEENMRLADVVRGSMEDFDYLYGLHDGDAIYEQVRRHWSDLSGHTFILTDGARPIRVYTPEGYESYPVQAIETVSTVGAGDNFNAGYIYAMLQGLDNQTSRIKMAQRWSQDVCRQIGNNISDELVASIKKQVRTTVRQIQADEIALLGDFLYEAIFIPEGVPAPPRSIIENEELQVYVKDFGKLPDDRCLVAECEGSVVGAVWTRIMNDYGHIAEDTPSLAISLYKDYRNRGIGTELLERMLQLLHRDGYKRVSLSVQKANYAVMMYKKAGFDVLKETDEELIMVCNLERKWQK